MAGVVWGWEEFFNQVRAFLESSVRHASTDNHEYCEFVVERLQVVISGVHHIRTVVRSAIDSVNHSDEETRELQEALDGIIQLLVILRSLSSRWTTVVISC